MDVMEECIRMLRGRPLARREGSVKRVGVQRAGVDPTRSVFPWSLFRRQAVERKSSRCSIFAVPRYDRDISSTTSTLERRVNYLFQDCHSGKVFIRTKISACFSDEPAMRTIATR
jgi:hypothetical protein